VGAASAAKASGEDGEASRQVWTYASKSRSHSHKHSHKFSHNLESNQILLMSKLNLSSQEYGSVLLSSCNGSLRRCSQTKAMLYWLYALLASYSLSLLPIISY